MRNKLKLITIIMMILLLTTTVFLQTMILLRSSSEIFPENVTNDVTTNDFDTEVNIWLDKVNSQFRPIGNHSIDQWRVAMYITYDLKRALHYADSIYNEFNPVSAEDDRYLYTAYSYEMAKGKYGIGESLKNFTPHTNLKKAIEYYEKAARSHNVDADIGRCYFRMGDRDKARYYFALAVINHYNHEYERKIHAEDKNPQNDFYEKRTFISICNRVIGAPYGLTSPFFDSRTFILFIKDGLESDTPEEKAIFIRAH